MLRRGPLAPSLLALAAACGGADPEPASSSLQVAELGEIQVTYLDGDLPALGPVALLGQEVEDVDDVSLSCFCDAERIIAVVSFGPQWEHFALRFALCRGACRLDLVGVDLLVLSDIIPVRLMPAPSGTVVVRRAADGVLAFAFDLKGLGGLKLSANAEVDLDACAPLHPSWITLGADPVALPDCPPAAR